jgi:hypothetical protein
MEENKLTDIVLRIERGAKSFVTNVNLIECPFCGQFLKVRNIGFPRTYDTTHDAAERVFYDSEGKCPRDGTVFITKDRIKQEVELYCYFCHGVKNMILVGDETIVSERRIK